jgi:hypothetical protein
MQKGTKKPRDANVERSKQAKPETRESSRKKTKDRTNK